MNARDLITLGTDPLWVYLSDADQRGPIRDEGWFVARLRALRDPVHRAEWAAFDNEAMLAEFRACGVA